MPINMIRVSLILFLFMSSCKTLAQSPSLTSDYKLYLYFKENDTTYHRIIHFSKDKIQFQFKIDKNPFIACFEAQGNPVAITEELNNIRDYTWFNNSYGWDNNIKTLKGHHDFNKKYKNIYLILIPSNRIVKVWDCSISED
jgi:hypothetical protein